MPIIQKITQTVLHPRGIPPVQNDVEAPTWSWWVDILAAVLASAIAGMVVYAKVHF